jgi:hypothetical protein
MTPRSGGDSRRTAGPAGFEPCIPDSLAGAAGFEPLHFRSEFANPLRIRTDVAAIERTLVALRRVRECTSAAPDTAILHARLCRKPATTLAGNDWLSVANRASLLRHG